MIPCIIPARGGSKGIPGKNIAMVGGKPLIAWSIEQAQIAQCVGTVTVATDSEEIAEVARRYGACVYWRSPESASDDAPSEAVLLEWVNTIDEPEAVLFLQATSPLRRPHDIDDAYETMQRTGANSIFGATRVHGYTWLCGGRGNVTPEHEHRKPRQQEQTRRLEENGSLYLFRPGVLRKTGSRLGGLIVPHIMHPLDSYQIDEPEDIALIELIMKARS